MAGNGIFSHADGVITQTPPMTPKNSTIKIVLFMPAKFDSHVFRGNLHEPLIEIPRVFGANIPTTHTAYASSFISVMGISFVDCTDRATVSTNSAGSTAGVRFRLERDVGVFLICPMTSGKVSYFTIIFIKIQ